MENWKLLLTGIRSALKETFNIKGSVEVSNFPEIHRVEVINPQEPTETVKVSNLIDYKEYFTKIIGELIKVPKDIKTADYTPIIKALQEVVRTLEADKVDYSPIILAIESAVKELKIEYPEVDYSEIINTIKNIKQFDLSSYLYKGELPVIINEKQIKKLVEAFGKKTGQVVAAMSGGGNVNVTSLPKSIQGPGNPSIDSYNSDDVNLAANTANQAVIAAPGANKQIWVYGLFGTVDVAGSISIQDEDDTALSGVMPVGITGGFVMNPSGNFAMPWIKVATNKALEIDTVTCTFDGIITYAIVSV